jgi:hypothetical protein
MRFPMGAENAKMKSAEKSAETGGHRTKPHFSLVFFIGTAFHDRSKQPRKREENGVLYVPKFLCIYKAGPIQFK